MAFVLLAWTARHLGVEQFGALNYALAFVALLSPLANLAADQIIVRDLVGESPDAGTTLGTSGCVATGRTSSFSLTGTFYNHGSKFRYTQGVSNAPSTTPVVINLGFVDPALTVPGLCHTVHSDGIVSYTLGTSSTTGSVSTTTFDNLPYDANAVGTTLFFQALAIDPGQAGIPAVLSNGRSYTIPADPALPAVGCVYEYPLSNGNLTQSGPWTGGIVARFVY